MSKKSDTILGSDLIKESNPKKLHEQARDYIIFQIYMSSEYIYTNYGLDALKNFYKFNQDKFFDLKMSSFYKLMEGIIQKLPKSLKIKEGLKVFIDQLQFLENPKNITLLEYSNETGIFEVTKCSFKKMFNKFAKKSNKLDLIDKCCVWCMETTPIAANYGLDYKIELTEKGCLNYLK